MPDNPNKRGNADRKRVSKQKHEQNYQRRKGSMTVSDMEPNASSSKEGIRGRNS